MSTAAAIRQMLAAGLSIEQALIAVEAMEQHTQREPVVVPVERPVTSGAIRMRNLRERRHAASQVTDSVTSDVTVTPPCPSLNDPLPNLDKPELNLNPPHPPIVPPAPRKADLTDAFDRFWLAYPKRGTASNPKQPARISFDKAVRAGADPEAIIAAAGRFDAIERAAGRAGTDKVAQAVTWLNQQRWGDYPEPVAAAEPTTLPNGNVHIMAGTEEWEAWRAHNGRSKPIDQRGGYWFASRWPPGWKRETPEREAPASDVFAFDEAGG